MRAEGFVPVPARPRRLCQPPWTQPINRKPRPTRMGANLQKNNQAYSQLLFGRGPGGGKDSHSRQWRLSMAVFLNRNKRPSAAPIEVADASLREAASPGVLPRSHPSYAFITASAIWEGSVTAVWRMGRVGS